MQQKTWYEESTNKKYKIIGTKTREIQNNEIWYKTSNSQPIYVDDIDIKSNVYDPIIGYCVLSYNSEITRPFAFRNDSHNFTEEGILTEIILPSSITDLPGAFLRNQDGIDKVDLSRCEKIVKIPEEFCLGCEKLWTVLLPPNITEIDWDFCRGCQELGYLELNKGITRIDDDFCCNCSNLKQIIGLQILELTYIGDRFLSECHNLSTEFLPNLEKCTHIGISFMQGVGSNLEQNKHLININVPLLESFEDNFLFNSNIGYSIIFSNIGSINKIGHRFLSYSKFKEVSFPAPVDENCNYIGNEFLANCELKMSTLSLEQMFQTSWNSLGLEYLGEKFLFNSGTIDNVYLPYINNYPYFTRNWFKDSNIKSIKLNLRPNDINNLNLFGLTSDLLYIQKIILNFSPGDIDYTADITDFLSFVVNNSIYVSKEHIYQLILNNLDYYYKFDLSELDPREYPENNKLFIRTIDNIDMIEKGIDPTLTFVDEKTRNENIFVEHYWSEGYQCWILIYQSALTYLVTQFLNMSPHIFCYNQYITEVLYFPKTITTCEGNYLHDCKEVIAFKLYNLKCIPDYRYFGDMCPNLKQIELKNVELYYITSIEISYNNCLESIKLNNIYNFTNFSQNVKTWYTLKVLDLSNNPDLSGIHLTDADLPNIEYFDISDCPNLRSFYVGGDYLLYQSNIRNINWFGLDSLETITVQKMFNYCPKLEFIYIESKKLKTISSSELGTGCENLHEITLDCPNLKTIDCYLGAKCPNLIFVNILSDEIPNNIEKSLEGWDENNLPFIRVKPIMVDTFKQYFNNLGNPSGIANKIIPY